MDKRTQKITMGAAVIAIFTVMILINRQTGSIFEELFLFIFPIPMAAFTARYGWKNSCPVLVGMAFFSFLFGSIYTFLYATSEVLVGMLLGECIYRKADQAKMLFLSMLSSAFFNVLFMVVLADLMGMNLEAEITEMQTMMEQLFTQYNMVIPPGMLSASSLMRIIVIDMILLGVLQGFVIYMLCLLILRRLGFTFMKPKSVYLYFPYRWTGYAALAAILFYYAVILKKIDSGRLYDISQVVGICGLIYLVIFGVLLTTLYAQRFGKMAVAVTMVLSIICCVAIPLVMPVMGFLYISTDYHYNILKSFHMAA